MDSGRFKHEVYFSQRPSKCSIVLNNIVKTVNNKAVLNQVNFTAHSGQICAVLGEHDSGKSMLLSCLVGGSEIDEGHIWVLGGKPRTKSSRTLTKFVGYMPQEFCLYQTVTFLELLAYFGQLYDINYDFIVWRIKYFYEMFKLPPTNVTIENLSNSEKRMVSFIVSIFHRPRLLVLDEPTIGLDIFKKLQIWNYLNQIIVRWKPTVIVATNNVEEAFLATKIAYLRKGKIVFDEEVEGLRKMNPKKSIDIIIEDHYNSIISNMNVNKHPSNQIEIPPNKKLTLFKKINPRSSVWKLKAVAMHHIKCLSRNIWMCILLSLIPILQVVLHCVYYGKYPRLLPIAVHNNEADCVINSCERLDNCYYYSCNLLHYFTMNKLKPMYYNSESLARDSIKTGINLAYMKIPSNYTKAIVKTIELIQSPSDYGYDYKSFDVDHRLSNYCISIEIDMSQLDFGNYLKQNLMEAHKSHLIAVYKHNNMSEEWADIPYKINEYKNLNLAENTASDIISCAIFSAAMFHSALLLQCEIQNGYFMRNIIAGVTVCEILLSFLCTQTIFSILQGFITFFFVDSLLYINWQSSLLLIILLNLVIGMCGMSIGLVIGSFAKSSKKVFCITLIVYFMNITMSGLFWPLYNRSNSNAIYLAVLMPLPIPMNSIKHIMIEGYKYNTKYILHAVIPITAWTSASILTFIYNH